MHHKKPATGTCRFFIKRLIDENSSAHGLIPYGDVVFKDDQGGVIAESTACYFLIDQTESCNRLILNQTHLNGFACCLCAGANFKFLIHVF